MSVARVTEISATSPQSFEDAIRQGLERATKTLRGVRAAWIKDQRVRLENDQIVEYQVIWRLPSSSRAELRVRRYDPSYFTNSLSGPTRARCNRSYGPAASARYERACRREWRGRAGTARYEGRRKYHGRKEHPTC